MSETLAKNRFAMPEPFFGTTQFPLDVLEMVVDEWLAGKK